MDTKPITTERPWGKFRQFTASEPSTVKLITIKYGQRLSLQYHQHRREFWVVLTGQPKIEIGKEAFTANPDDEFEIPPTVPHRISAGDAEVKILEISFGRFNEDDIVRLEDDYGRD
jgi:mannose-6-phosphate isomerase-like protein (cupin superfamily)